MSSQIRQYETPFRGVVDENGKNFSASKNTDVCSNPLRDLHNPMYGADDRASAPLRDDGKYSKLNSHHNLNVCSKNATGTVSYEGIKTSEKCWTGDKKKRLVCVLFIVTMIITIIAAFVSFSVAFSKISDLNEEVATLQQNIMAGTAMQNYVIQAINQTQVDIWLAIARLTPHALGSIGNPAASCSTPLALDPYSPSGYYWIRSSNGSAVSVYCDMTRSCGGVTGGWTRVAELDMTNNSSLCPGKLTEHTYSNIRACRIASSGASCSSVTLSTGGIKYSKICGRVQAYQQGTTDAFGLRNNPDINTPYVDGVSLTRGNLRQHIWTFAAALHQHNSRGYSNCPCSHSDGNAPPIFVGNDYFCETGSEGKFENRLFTEDPLWDGEGCIIGNECCSFNSPPWFYKKLTAPTTDNIEMRVCRDESSNNEDIVLESYDIFIQ